MLRPVMCPVDAGLMVMAGRWKPRILWKLRRYDLMRYSHLKRELAGITDKMLAQQLRELERDGLIIRTVHPVVPPNVDYALTEFGQTLAPVIDALAAWSRAHEATIREVLARSPAAVDPAPT